MTRTTGIAVCAANRVSTLGGWQTNQTINITSGGRILSAPTTLTPGCSSKTVSSIFCPFIATILSVAQLGSAFMSGYVSHLPEWTIHSGAAIWVRIAILDSGGSVGYRRTCRSLWTGKTFRAVGATGDALSDWRLPWLYFESVDSRRFNWRSSKGIRLIPCEQCDETQQEERERVLCMCVAPLIWLTYFEC